MTAAPRPNLTHLGIFVWDIRRMESFYSEVLGLVTSDRGHSKRFQCDLVFMTGDATKHHQLVLAGARPRDATFSSVFQISFVIRDLDSLRGVRQKALANGATELYGVNHGNALSIYFRDPEGNLVEVYLDTPYYVQQPHGDPLNLDLSDGEIWRQTEEVCRKDPSFMLKNDFEAKIASTFGKGSNTRIPD